MYRLGTKIICQLKSICKHNEIWHNERLDFFLLIRCGILVVDDIQELFQS